MVIVLNGDYSFLSHCSVERAMILTYIKDKAEIIEYSSNILNTINKKYIIPTIIRIRYYVKIKFKKFLPFSKKSLFKRDNYKCGYCGSSKDITMDHIIPLSKGGKTCFENCVVSCRKCNMQKGDSLLCNTNLELQVKVYKPMSIMAKWWNTLKL
jgi:5-methylcytosine-specific restriction endonuclease McrA